MLIDSHCHLDFPDFASELDAVVGRAKSAGVGHMLTISTRVRKFDEVLAVAERFPEVTCSIGTHPHYASEERDITLEEIVEQTRNPRVVAIGEALLCDRCCLISLFRHSPFQLFTSLERTENPPEHIANAWSGRSAIESRAGSCPFCSSSTRLLSWIA